MNDAITGNILVKNQTNIEIKNVKLQLKEKLTFTAESPWKKTSTSSKTVKEVALSQNNSSNLVQQYQNKEFEFRIPLEVKDEIKFFAHCRIIQSEYVLLVVLKPTGMHLSMKLEIPVIIGSKKLKRNESKEVEATKGKA